MVDFFLLLMLAGAGDELQGIKRGIMELADCIAITKADSGNEILAKKAKITYENALHLFPPNPNGWTPTAQICSSYLKKGISTIWETIVKHREQITGNGWLLENRSNQNVFWMNQRIEEQLKNEFYQIPNIKDAIKAGEKDVKSGKINPFLAADKILKNR